MATKADITDDVDELCAIAINRKLYRIPGEPGFLIIVCDDKLARFTPSQREGDASRLQTELGIQVTPPNTYGLWTARLGEDEVTGKSYCEAVSALGAAVGSAICKRERDTKV